MSIWWIWSSIQHFTESEFAPHADEMTGRLLRKLDDTRHIADVPIYITSHYRPGDDGAHGIGDAVDISDNSNGDDIGSRWRHRVLDAAYACKFRRIGIYDKHIHLDISVTRDQDVTWIGTSK